MLQNFLNHSKLYLSFIALIISIALNLSAETSDPSIIALPMPDPNNEKAQEQISCEESVCIKLEMKPNNTDKVLDEIYVLMGKQAGKIVVEIEESTSKIDSLENTTLREYLREISKRDGKVVFEPYYINTRGAPIPDIPVFKDILSVSYNIYKKLRSYFLYDRAGKYNAKILYHPVTHEVLLYYFVHKSYGDICDTVYSQCDLIEYLDDETFDYQLTQALSKEISNSIPKHRITVNFKKTKASLPSTSIELEALLGMNQSARLYKWLVASKKVDKQNIKRERFVTAGFVISLIDYSLTAYDYIQQYRMYRTASNWTAIASYEDTEDGALIRSVTFEKTEE